MPSPYPLREHLLRLIWQVVWLVLFRPVPRHLSAWHRMLLRLFGARVGRGAVIHPSVRVHFPWTLDLGPHAIIGDRVRLYSLASIRIGAHTAVSQDSHLCAGTHDYTDPRMPLVRLPIVVGASCWICADVFVGPGVTIGDGSVVGARSVVVKDLPPATVCAGNPCRPIRPRIMKRPEASPVATPGSGT